VHQYQATGTYSARIAIPALNIEKVLIENVEIKGKSN